ncbi:hypothetical protein MJM95_30435, partial [Salmonella enterica subsp. enterica serovar Anatum]|nr:hypothetical protein [Salmonella enterica subsp. enterica serovar Anatum]
DSGALGDFTTNNKTPTLVGNTLPNAIVSIYVDGVKVGEATAETIIEECTKRGIHTHIFLSSNRVQTNIDLVAKNEGISFILDAV